MSWSFFSPLSFLERLETVGNLLVGSESACGFLGDWVSGGGGQGPARVGSEEGTAEGSAGQLGLEGWRACRENWGRAAGWSCSLLASAGFEVAPTGRRWLCILAPPQRLFGGSGKAKQENAPTPAPDAHCAFNTLTGRLDLFRNKGR